MGKITNSEKNTITIDEQELLDNYRVLDKWGKHEVQEMIAYQQFKRVRNEYFASQKERQQPDEEAKQKSNIIRFRDLTV